MFFKYVHFKPPNLIILILVVFLEVAPTIPQHSHYLKSLKGNEKDIAPLTTFNSIFQDLLAITKLESNVLQNICQLLDTKSKYSISKIIDSSFYIFKNVNHKHQLIKVCFLNIIHHI